MVGKIVDLTARSAREFAKTGWRHRAIVSFESFSALMMVFVMAWWRARRLCCVNVWLLAMLLCELCAGLVMAKCY